jgi:hypothetical protein
MNIVVKLISRDIQENYWTALEKVLLKMAYLEGKGLCRK